MNAQCLSESIPPDCNLMAWTAYLAVRHHSNAKDGYNKGQKSKDCKGKTYLSLTSGKSQIGDDHIRHMD